LFVDASHRVTIASASREQEQNVIVLPIILNFECFLFINASILEIGKRGAREKGKRFPALSMLNTGLSIIHYLHHNRWVVLRRRP
jgi:hypothetical protein